MVNVKKITNLSLICALSVIVFTAEGLLPPLLFFAPGTKIGLASIFVCLAYILYGKKEAAAVLFVKCFFGALFSGNMFSLLYSIPSGIVSLAATILLYEFAYPKTGIVSVSVTAAVLHNITQIAMAAIITATLQVFYYSVIVAAAGVIAGVITGVCLYYIIKNIPVSYSEIK